MEKETRTTVERDTTTQNSPGTMVLWLLGIVLLIWLVTALGNNRSGTTTTTTTSTTSPSSSLSVTVTPTAEVSIVPTATP